MKRFEGWLFIDKDNNLLDIKGNKVILEPIKISPEAWEPNTATSK